MLRRRPAALTLVVALAAVGTSVTGQTSDRAQSQATVARADTAGVSAERLARIDAMLQFMMMLQLLPNTTDIREKLPLMVYQALQGSPRLK